MYSLRVDTTEYAHSYIVRAGSFSTKDTTSTYWNVNIALAIDGNHIVFSISSHILQSGEASM